MTGPDVHSSRIQRFIVGKLRSHYITEAQDLNELVPYFCRCSQLEHATTTQPLWRTSAGTAHVFPKDEDGLCNGFHSRHGVRGIIWRIFSVEVRCSARYSTFTLISRSIQNSTLYIYQRT